MALGFADDCYRNGHLSGEVLSGAFWKMRERLKRSQGASGGFVADCLHNAWMNAYDGDSVETIIRTQLLILDDVSNSGQGLGDGTPHWADIDLGFADQGFSRDPTMATGIEFTNVMDPSQTTDETGPYEISADIVANFAPPIQSAKLYYRVNGGLFSDPVTMVEDPVTGTFSATIPGQMAPAVVEYYLTAEDSMAGYSQTGQTAEYPVSVKVAMDATADQLDGVHTDEYDENRYEAHEATPTYGRFFVGEKDTLFFEDFEDPDEDWAHDGTSDDDWQFGVPAGDSGAGWADPATAYSPSNCVGNDLGTAGGIAGAYEHGANNWLLTPIIANPRPPGTKTFLRFQRWLSVDEWTNDVPTYLDNAEIIVINDPGPTQTETVVWKNHRALRHIDNATSTGDWLPFEIEITDALSVNVPCAQIRWTLRSDASIPGDTDLYGGWTIDDVEVFTIKPVP